MKVLAYCLASYEVGFVGSAFDVVHQINHGTPGETVTQSVGADS